MDHVLRRLDDENQIRRLVIRMSNAMDMRDAAMFRECFADEVELDIPPLGGDSVPLSGMLRADDYAAGVIRLLSEFKATQHVSTNHDISVAGDSAACTCYTLATHLLPLDDGDQWSTIGARYDMEARRLPDAGWRIARFKWTRLWSSGNALLWQEVSRRLAAG